MLMLLLLLLSFNQKLPQQVDVQFVETFAGQGEISKYLRELGMRGSTHELNLSPGYMDLTSTCGFLQLGLIWNNAVYIFFRLTG